MAPKKFKNRKPRRSLRTILMVWFLLFSVVPVAFVTGYSLVKYEQAIDNELVQRLRANVREFATTIAEYERYLNARLQRNKDDTSLIYYLSTSSIGQARALMQQTMRNSHVAKLSLFDRDGRMVVMLTGDGQANEKRLEEYEIFLNDQDKAAVDKSGQLSVVDASVPNSLSLVKLAKLETKTGRPAGYIEETITIGLPFLESLKKRLNLEILLFDPNAAFVAASHPDFQLYPKDYFISTIKGENEAFFDLNVREEPFGFITTPVKWGDTSFLVGLGASKQKAKAILKNVNYAFFTMIGAIIVLVFFSSIVTARMILRPLNTLVEALQTMDQKDQAVEVPVTSDNELGVLTESFNEMSQRVVQARTDLEKKIKELESAYLELKETQARLVHSAKMASLGQLVAGVAHELNNPIGFIYSNMSHLRDYSSRLFKIIEAAEQDPKAVERLKKDLDLDYVTQDLPRLIQSCEEGARRTRDIVLGLRNFSRLEEAKIKRVSIQEGIENTLRLLAGELKARIRVHHEFEPLPEVLCYASQLNQVFMNILSNAAQAIEGEGDIWIHVKHLGEPKGGGRAQVSIRDSGKGIAAEALDRIFDPFFTTKTVGNGTGLGLSISYGIIKKHGGDIQVKSEVGKGTEFIITLPVDGPPGTEFSQSAS